MSTGNHDVLLSVSLVDAVLQLLSETGGRSRLRIAGDSMSPLLRDGYGVVVEHGAEIGLGDVVVYKCQGGMVVHRVVRVLQNNDGAVCVTKGDNRTGLDPPINRERVVSRVVLIETPSGNIDLASEPWRTLNPVIARCSYIQALIYEKGRVIKRRLIGDRTNRLVYRGAKAVLLPLFLLIGAMSRFKE